MVFFMTKQRRLQVSCSPELWEILNELSERYGVSMGSLCGNFLAEATPYFRMILETLKKADDDKSEAFLMMAKTLDAVHQRTRLVRSECIEESKVRRKAIRRKRDVDNEE